MYEDDGRWFKMTIGLFLIFERRLLYWLIANIFIASLYFAK